MLLCFHTKVLLSVKCLLRPPFRMLTAQHLKALFEGHSNRLADAYIFDKAGHNIGFAVLEPPAGSADSQGDQVLAQLLWGAEGADCE